MVQKLVVSIYPQWDDEFKATSEDIFQLPMFASQFFTSMEDIHTMSANVPTIWAMIQYEIPSNFPRNSVIDRDETGTCLVVNQQP